MLCRIARAERNHRFCSFWKVIWYYTILYHCDLWIDSIHMYHHISLCLICTCFTDADWLSASTLNSLGLDIAGQWVVNLEYTWRQTAYALLSQRKDCPSSILGLDEIRTPLYIYLSIYLMRKTWKTMVSRIFSLKSIHSPKEKTQQYAAIDHKRSSSSSDHGNARKIATSNGMAAGAFTFGHATAGFDCW
jgi:hypothetical protein